MKDKKLKLKQRENLFGWVFVLPFIIGFAVFLIYPIFTSFRLAFSELLQTVGISQMEFVGFKHFIRAFTEDIKFLPSFLETVYNALLHTPFIVIFSLVIAILLNKKIRFRAFWRLIFFLPFVLGTGYISKMLMDLGVMERSTNLILDLFGAENGGVAEGSLMAISAELLQVVVQVLWKTAVQILLFLSGLQGISVSLYESARCDGATEWEMFWKITMPMISPVMLLVCVYTIIDSFTDINNSVIELFQDYAFRFGEYEYASAIILIYFVFIILLLGLVFAIFRPLVFYAGEK